MLSNAVEKDEYRTRVFGFLHALDVSGAALAAVLVLIVFNQNTSYRILFLATAVPLAASTLVLLRAETGASLPVRSTDSSHETEPRQKFKLARRSKLLARALYGFTFYSIGFPVLTVAQKTNSFAAAITSFLIFQAISAATEYFGSKHFGKHLLRKLISLALLRYMISALGAVVTVDLLLHSGTLAHLVGVALLGNALGVIDALEPALISELCHERE